MVRNGRGVHPMPHGRSVTGESCTFWAFVVAILIFAVGAGVSIYEGYLHVTRPNRLPIPLINYVVLGVAFVLEGSSCLLAVREFDRKRGQSGWWQAIHESKDPASFIVLFEDSAALVGLCRGGMRRLGQPCLRSTGA